MKNILPEVARDSLDKPARRPASSAYLGIGVVSVLVVVVWVLFSSFDIRDVNGWLPYHVPVSIVLSAVLLALTLWGWVKMLLGGEPATSLTEAAPHQDEVPSPRGGSITTLFRRPPRVLVVDDDPCVRMVLCKKLNALGVQASAVCDGVEALLAVADRSWDMVLMDGEMPVMDGIKAAREIRAQHLLDECAPIVGISNNQDAGFLQRCRSAGISACLPKPRNTKDLEILLNEFLVPGPPGRGRSTEPMPTNFEAVG